MPWNITEFVRDWRRAITRIGCASVVILLYFGGALWWLLAELR